MNLRNLFKYGLMAIFIFQNAIQNAIGMESDQDDKLLVIGCRPWDDNMRGFSGLRTAHFVDFMDMGAPSIIPPNFYHLDVNDKEMYSSGKFSDFANNNIGKYKTIIVDWITYQHIHRDGAWSDFAKLLDANGDLIVPVTYTSFKDGPMSFEKAEEFINEKKLNNLFNPVNILSYNEVSQDTRFDLLHRPSLEPGRLEYHIKMKPAIILAKKQSDTTEDTENVSESEPMTPERREVKIQSLSPTEEEELTQESPTTYVPSDGKYKEVKFPRIAKIKEDLIEGRSTLSSETGDVFSVQSILGRFFGFRPEAIEKGFDVKLKYVGNSVDDKGIYHLSGVLDIITDDSKLPIQLFLKSLDGQQNKYIIYGGTPTMSPNHYKVSDSEQVKIFIE